MLTPTKKPKQNQNIAISDPDDSGRSRQIKARTERNGDTPLAQPCFVNVLGRSMNLTEQIEAARAELTRLERLAESATCAELGHDWVSLGGCNCGCHEDASCSVPVLECSRCGDCDYGENDEAAETRRLCQETHPERHEPREHADAPDRAVRSASTRSESRRSLSRNSSAPSTRFFTRLSSTIARSAVATKSR